MDEATGYHVVLAAESMGPITTSAGVGVLPDVTFGEVSGKAIDTLMVPGAVEVDGGEGCVPSRSPRWWIG